MDLIFQHRRKEYFLPPKYGALFDGRKSVLSIGALWKYTMTSKVATVLLEDLWLD